MFLGSGKVLGIDIGRRDLKIIQLKGMPKDPNLAAWAIVAKEKRSFEGNGWRPDLFEDIALSLQIHGIKGGKAYVSLPDDMVRLSYRKLPAMPPAELKSAIIWEIRKEWDMTVEEMVVDYIEMGEVVAGPNRMNAYLAAVCKKRPVEFLGRSLLDMGVKVQSLEFSTLAQISCLLASGSADGAIGLVDLGASQTNLIILKDGSVRFFRMIPSGGDSISEAISQATGLTWWEAEKHKRMGVPSGEGGDEQMVRAFRGTLELIIDEVFQTLRFYVAERKEGPVERLVLTGGGALMPGVEGPFQDVLGLPVEVLNPFGNLPVSSGVRDSDMVVSQGGRLVTALGLALKE
ncbi:MAG: type IV pilus assembly protein PilM [Deltaproteobacteria bacterium]|nr:type IV pilus assembly protein PilM [Deltaproteobacteria bacterium]